MLYVTRNQDGFVQTVSKLPLAGGELLPENSSDVQAFLGLKAVAPTFDSTDADFVRVLEDVIDMLIMKNIIRHTDLPAAAQKKLMIRKGLRNRMQGALDLLGSDEQIL